MRYEARGQLPAKRHVAFRDNGTLLTEEVMGFEGFSGNESILYHLQTPCRVIELGAFEPIEHAEWVPAAHAHHLFHTRGIDAQGDPVRGRRVLMFNDDVEIAICRPSEPQEYFYRDGEGDEVIFVHRGGGELETTFGTLPYREHDYIVIPRGTTYRFRPHSLDEQLYLTFQTPGEIETPSRYRNRYGQLLEHAPYSHRDFHPPTELITHRERGEYELVVRARRGYQTFQGPNFVICSFCPRMLDWHEEAIPIPYNHSNLQSEEMIYYVSGSFGSRRGIDVGSIPLHASGLPHGPQPGLAVRFIDTGSTDELAVMCDTFRPLRLTQLARELDDGRYALSWAEDAPAGGQLSPAGATSHR